jgi:hypothetical protein
MVVVVGGGGGGKLSAHVCGLQLGMVSRIQLVVWLNTRKFLTVRCLVAQEGCVVDGLVLHACKSA